MSNEADGNGEASGNDRSKPSPETLAKLEEVRGKVAAGFTQVVMAMMATPRYRHLSIVDLEWLVLEPLLHNCIAVAATREKLKAGAQPMVGVAIWAKVSSEVGKAIEEQVKAGTFPIRLKTGDWKSGETIWLLDVIAPSRTLATNVLVNFGQITKGAPVHIHPMIARIVDAEVLKKLSRSEVPIVN